MSDAPSLADDLDAEQVAALEAELGTNLTGIQAVANDTKDYFLARAVEEGLDGDEMLTCINAVDGAVSDAYVKAMPVDGDDHPIPEDLAPRPPEPEPATNGGVEPAEQPEPVADVSDVDLPETPMSSRADTQTAGDDGRWGHDSDGDELGGSASDGESGDHPTTDGGAVRTDAPTDAQDAQSTSLLTAPQLTVGAYAAAFAGAAVYFTARFAPLPDAGLYAAMAFAVLAVGAVFYEAAWGETA